MKWLLPVLISSLIAFFNPEHADAQLAEARWAVEESFALGTVRGELGYPIVTFIPRTFLLFDIDNREPDLKVGTEFAAVTTQDGRRVYVLENTISKLNVRKGLGTPAIIFNAGQKICREIQCDSEDDNQLLQIDPGEVFETSEVLPDVLKLKGIRNKEEIVGYVGRAKLDDLNKSAIITRATLRHPRLTVKRTIARLVATQCGEQLSAGIKIINTTDVNGVDQFTGADKVVFDMLDIGNVRKVGKEYRISYKKTFGNPNQEYEFRVYKIVDHQDNDRKTVYVTQIVYNCEVSGTVSKRKSIISVEMLSKTEDNITLDMKTTPQDLKKYIGHPYLYSVNTSSQYFDWMLNIGSKFANRALAGYFLSEFNRSCKSHHRRKNYCSSHVY